MIDDYSDYLGIILQTEEHISDLINNKPFYLCIFEEIVMLNIDFERFAL